jgi:hypothetical protein
MPVLYKKESIMSVKDFEVELSRVHSRQVAEQSKFVPKVEARGQHRRTGNAAPSHATDSKHVTGVDSGVAKRSECEESHRRS